MKSWKKPTNELIDRAYGMMKKQFDHEYFFTRLKNPLWIQPLVERGCFQSPPKMRKLPGGYIQTPVWPELRYLKNVVMDATDEGLKDEVLEVVKALPETDNPRVYDDILDIALQLDAKRSAKLLPKMLESTELDQQFSAYQYAKLLAHWIKQNQIAVALELSKILVEFVPDSQSKAKQKRRRKKSPDLATMADTSLEPSPRFNSMEYRRILSEGVRPLAEKEPYKVACVLIDTTADMIHLRTHESDLAEQRDHSEAWCERLAGSKDELGNAESSLVHTLTFACEQVHEKKTDSVEDLDGTLRAQPWGIFKRLRQYLYAKYPNEIAKPWIRQLILEHGDYHLGEHRYEFQRMVECACNYFGESLLAEDERERIFNDICSGPSKANHQIWLKWLGKEFTEEGFWKRQRGFHRMQFRPFAPLLFGDYADYFHELEMEANDPISDDDYPPFKTRGGHVSTRSPRAPEDLANLTDEELLSFINEWDEIEDIFEGNNLIEVNVQGLSTAFQHVFKEHIIPVPERHRFWMENSERIKRTTFVERIIYVMQDRIATRDFKYLDEWLIFSEWVLSHSDDRENEIYDIYAGESPDHPNWSDCQWAVIDVIRACFGKDVKAPLQARKQLAKLLDTLCTQFNRRLDQHLTRKRPIDEGMNNPRCRALEALVDFGFWLRRSDKAIYVPEVMHILEKRFAPEAEYPLTPPEYAILGRNYDRLFHLNEAWTTTHKSDLFPQDEFPKWLAAFDNLLGFNPLSERAFEIFQDDFIFALDHLSAIKKQDRPDDKLIDMLGQCLYIFYLEKLYPLRGEASLLEGYYQASDDDREQWANLFDYVGHRLWNVTEDLNIDEKKRNIDFFEWRFEVGEPVELQQFTYWLKADCLDAQWRLSTYSEILDITRAEDMSITMEVEALCDMLPNHTGKVVECFAKLTKDIGDNNISIFKEEATAILQAGFKSSEGSVRKNAESAHENLLRIGRFDLLDLDI